MKLGGGSRLCIIREPHRQFWVASQLGSPGPPRSNLLCSGNFQAANEPDNLQPYLCEATQLDTNTSRGRGREGHSTTRLSRASEVISNVCSVSETSLSECNSILFALWDKGKCPFTHSLDGEGEGTIPPGPGPFLLPRVAGNRLPAKVLRTADCLVCLVVMERSDTQAIKPLSSPARGRERATSVIVGREQIFHVTRLTLSPIMSSARQLLTRLTQVPQCREPRGGVSTAASLGPRQPPSRPQPPSC